MFLSMPIKIICKTAPLGYNSYMKNCLIKISGDLTTPPEKLIEFIRQISNDFFVVICLGGGTQINKAFENKGFEIKFGPLGRETNNLEQRQLARDILEINQAKFQDVLQKAGVHAAVVIPAIEVGTVLCHVNGDQYVLAAYNGFDSIFIVTLYERLEAKKKDFIAYPKIEVISI